MIRPTEGDGKTFVRPTRTPYVPVTTYLVGALAGENRIAGPTLPAGVPRRRTLRSCNPNPDQKMCDHDLDP